VLLRIAGQQLPAATAEKSSQVVVVNYNGNNNNKDNDDDNDDDKAITSFGYDVTEPPAARFLTDDADLSDSVERGQEVAADQKPPFDGLEQFVGKEQINLWLNEWRKMKLSGEPESRIQEWVKYLFDRYGRRVVGSRPCTLRRYFYRAAVRRTPCVGTASPPCTTYACNK